MCTCCSIYYSSLTLHYVHIMLLYTAADVNINTTASDSTVMEGASANICVDLMDTSPNPSGTTVTLEYDLIVPISFADGKAGKQSMMYNKHAIIVLKHFRHTAHSFYDSLLTCTLRYV